MQKHSLINIRGAGGSGKTTAVRQYCLLHNCRTEQVKTCSKNLAVSVLDNGIVVMGDYRKKRTCLGADNYKDGSKDLQDALFEIVSQYRPRAVIYEHKLSSTSAKSTKELIKLAEALNYEYHGVYFKISIENRKRNMYRRSGKLGKKFYHDHTLQITNNMIRDGIDVEIIDVDEYEVEDMWRIVDDAVRKTVE